MYVWGGVVLKPQSSVLIAEKSKLSKAVPRKERASAAQGMRKVKVYRVSCTDVA